MFFKKKCPNCGAKNDKERTVCVECGAPFALGWVEGRVAQVSTEGETQAKKGLGKVASEKARDKYRGDERVLYKTLEQPAARKKSANSICLPTPSMPIS